MSSVANPSHARRRRNSGNDSNARIVTITGTIGVLHISNRRFAGGTAAETDTLILNVPAAFCVGAVQLPFGTVVLQEKLTLGGFANPLVHVSVALPLPALLVTAIEAGIVTEKSPPVPVNCTVCIWPPEVTVKVPVTGPAAVGLKVTFRVHMAPAATEPEQLSDSAKPALAAVVKLIDAADVFVNVTG